MEKLNLKSSLILIGEPHQVIKDMNRTLKHEIAFVRGFENLDISSVSHHYQKTSLLFSDVQSCIDYLRSGDPLSSELRIYLVMDRNGKFKEETEAALQKAGVQIFIPRSFQELISDVKTNLLCEEAA